MAREPDAESGPRPSARQRILDTALRLFSDHGYGETSVSELARAAEVSKGLVYHYFETKREVLEAVVDRGTGRMEGVLAPGDGSAETAAPAALVMEVLGLVAEDLRWWRLYYRLRMQPELSGSLDLGEQGLALERALARSLEASGAGGRSEAGARVPEARALAAAVEGVAQRYVLDPEGYPLVEVAEALVAGYVEPRPPGPRDPDSRGAGV